ncbi:MAG: hypothetical protein AAF662_05515 [Pseudomonadota bacterium]
MKNQYLADINDFKKYGLLRSILAATNWKLTVAWMLTPDDGSTDGAKRAYLDQPQRYRKHDPELFDRLSEVAGRERPTVAEIREAGVLDGAVLLEDVLPATAGTRARWLKALLERSSDSDIVFLDPDNGIEVKSVAFGGRNAHKYVFWRELEAIWGLGKSLFVYQHFPREERRSYMTRMIRSLSGRLDGATVTGFRTANVVFFLVTQPGEDSAHLRIRRAVADQWGTLVSEFRVVTLGAQKL